MPSQHDAIILSLIESVDEVLEKIEENWSADLRTAKEHATELREELEELLEDHED